MIQMTNIKSSSTIEKLFNAEEKDWEKGYKLISFKSAIATNNYQRDWIALQKEYENLPLDPYDKLRTRSRRLGRGVYFPWKGVLEWLPESHGSQREEYSPYFQGYHNNEHIENWRYFPTLTDELRTNKVLNYIAQQSAMQCFYKDLDYFRPAGVNVHLISQRVTEDFPIATVSPNCMHQDGEMYDFVYLIGRKNVVDGKNCIAHTDQAGKQIDDVSACSILEEYTLFEELSGFGVRDEYVSHGVSPIALKPGKKEGYRNTILVDVTPMYEKLR